MSFLAKCAMVVPVLVAVVQADATQQQSIYIPSCFVSLADPPLAFSAEIMAANLQPCGISEHHMLRPVRTTAVDLRVPPILSRTSGAELLSEVMQTKRRFQHS